MNDVPHLSRLHDIVEENKADLQDWLNTPAGLFARKRYLAKQNVRPPEGLSTELSVIYSRYCNFVSYAQLAQDILQEATPKTYWTFGGSEVAGLDIEIANAFLPFKPRFNPKHADQQFDMALNQWSNLDKEMKERQEIADKRIGNSKDSPALQQSLKFGANSLLPAIQSLARQLKSDVIALKGILRPEELKTPPFSSPNTQAGAVITTTQARAPIPDDIAKRAAKLGSNIHILFPNQKGQGKT